MSWASFSSSCQSSGQSSSGSNDRSSCTAHTCAGLSPVSSTVGFTTRKSRCSLPGPQGYLALHRWILGGARGSFKGLRHLRKAPSFPCSSTVQHSPPLSSQPLLFPLPLSFGPFPLAPLPLCPSFLLSASTSSKCWKTELLWLHLRARYGHLLGTVTGHLPVVLLAPAARLWR